MKNYFFALLALLTLSSCCLIKGTPCNIRTYELKGDIELINDCTGLGTDNPTSIQLIAVLEFTDGSTQNFVQQVPLVTVGVTSTGSYEFVGTPTNSNGNKWKVDFPKACSYINCTSGSCENGSTNARQPILISKNKTKHNYRYSCSCR
jgi:hypothetical protein